MSRAEIVKEIEELEKRLIAENRGYGNARLDSLREYSELIKKLEGYDEALKDIEKLIRKKYEKVLYLKGENELYVEINIKEIIRDFEKLKGERK